MIEFTGERVIPGQVNADLWAEHTARYAFAAGFSPGEAVLDAGCGSGYGCVQLSRTAASVVGIDSSAEAIAYARATADPLRIRYTQGSVTAMPFAAEAFGLVTAFEVIEHLEDWNALLTEASRVLRREGLLLVSTPNRLYYAESRAEHGPNPYHVHEFGFSEFQSALAQVFPHSRVLLQNRVESFAFYDAQPTEPERVRIESASADPTEANFFLAVCGKQPLPHIPGFVFVPRAANLLREREHHIRLLEQELALTKSWLDQNQREHAELQRHHEALTSHLEEKNRWAKELETLWKDAQQRIVQLQSEFAAEQARAAEVAQGYARKVSELEQENLAKTTWALDTEARLTAELQQRAAQLAETVRHLNAAEATVVERTLRVQNLAEQFQLLRAQLDMIRESRWVKLGRTVGLGPDVSGR